MLIYICDVCRKRIKIYLFIDGDNVKHKCAACESKIDKKAQMIYKLLKEFQLLDKEKQDEMINSYQCAANISNF